MIIPKIIHHIVPRDKSDWHPVWDMCLHSWYVQCPEPEYKHMFWMDDEIESFVSEFFPQYHQSVCNFDYHVNKIDFMRWLILYQYGGIYADMDYMCYQNFFEDIIKPVAVVLSPSKSENHTNILMASVPMNRLLLDFAEQSIENYNTKVYNNRNDCVIDLGVNCPDYVREKNPDHFDHVVQSLPVSIYNPSYNSFYRKEMDGVKGFHFLTGLWGKDDVESIKRNAKSQGITYKQALKRYFYIKHKKNL